MSTATSMAYNYSVAGHLSFSAPKHEKAQKSSGFWANRTYRLCIKDNVLIEQANETGGLYARTYCGISRWQYCDVNCFKVFQFKSDYPYVTKKVRRITHGKDMSKDE